MATFSLPKLLGFDPSGLREICSRGAALKGNCPKRSRVGSGYARTPLLDRPLKGVTYIVQPRGSGSPDLWTTLEGEGLRVDVRAETAIGKRGVETRLVDLPDFPLHSFALRLSGGRHGVFELRSDLCSGRPRALAAPLTVAGHNGSRQNSSVRLTVAGDCGDGG